MQEVSIACGFSLAEALQPREDGRCLVQSGASWHRDLVSELFHKHSSDLIFPPNVGIPGRCWKLRRVQLHADVTTLPPTIFLRSEMAQKAGLRGGVAIPLHVEGTQLSFVTLYLAPYDLHDQNLAREISDKALGVTREVLRQAGAGCAVRVPTPLPMEALTAPTSATAWLSQSRTWLKCELALGKQPQERTAVEGAAPGASFGSCGGEEVIPFPL